MQILQLSGETTVEEIAIKAYGLKTNDPRLAAATKNLVAANPSLAMNQSALRKGMVITIPSLDGAAPSSGATNIDSLAVAFRSRLQNLSAGVNLAAIQRSAPSTVTAPLGTAPAPAGTAAPPALPELDFTVLRKDLAAFIKLYGS